MKKLIWLMTLLSLMCIFQIGSYAAPSDWNVPWDSSISIRGTTYNGHSSKGIAFDFAKTGTVKLYAPTEGIITKMVSHRAPSYNTYPSLDYGNYIQMTTNDGYTVIMAHMMSIDGNIVSKGIGGKISRGEFIGYMGNTGCSTGQHLHFEVIPSVSNLFGYTSNYILSNLIKGSGGIATPPAYQISFNANGGTLDSGYKTAYYTDLVNVARGVDCMVICNEGTSTGHNKYGVEAIVDANCKVTNIIDGVGNAAIPNDGFVISGNGTARQWILDNIEIGDYTFYNEGITKLTVWDKNQWLTRGISVQSNSTYGDLPVPLSREGYVFDGWYTAVSGGTKIISSSKFTANTNQTLYAHWSIPEYYITFDGNGGETDTADKAGYYTDLVNTTRGANSMVVFDGGGTTTGTNEYGSEVLVDSNHRVVSIEYRKGNATVPSGGVVVSGHGTAAAWINSNVEVGDWLFYNSNIDKIILRSENTFLTLSKMVSPGNPYGKLPIPKNREGYIFKGWYTEANEGTQITSDTIVTINSDQTLYAKWAKPLIIESYTYSVDEKKLDVTVNVDESLEEQKGYVIIALYNGDKLMDVHHESAKALVSHTFENISPADKYELKVFCWSDFDTMIPLCTALTEIIQ